MLGYEVMPSNVAYTAEHLKLTYDEWDYNQTAPQAAAFKAWVKGNLAAGAAIAFFPMCKGDGGACYPDSCPGDPAGVVDHVEPIYGIYSNHNLDDATVYDDVVIVHLSVQDKLPYYRAMSTLEDTPAMEGNCADAQPGFGKNEMYPCFDQSVTYGLAVTGLQVAGGSSGLLPVSLTVNTTAEPDVRRGEDPAWLRGEVEVVLPEAAAGNITLYRFTGTGNLPAGPPFGPGADKVVSLEVPTAGATSLTWADPDPFLSNKAVYYLAEMAE